MLRKRQAQCIELNFFCFVLENEMYDFVCFAEFFLLYFSLCMSECICFFPSWILYDNKSKKWLFYIPISVSHRMSFIFVFFYRRNGERKKKLKSFWFFICIRLITWTLSYLRNERKKLTTEVKNSCAAIYKMNSCVFKCFGQIQIIFKCTWFVKRNDMAFFVFQ